MAIKVHIIVFFLLALTGTAWAQQPSVIDLMMRLQSSVVEVRAINSGIIKSEGGRLLIADTKAGVMLPQYQALRLGAYERNGAGVIIHRSGVIVTNAHTVNKAKNIAVILDDQTVIPAQVIRFVNNIDCALLKIVPPYAMTPVAVADSNDIHLGDEVFTVGSSPLLKESITGGKVIGLGSQRTVSQQGITENDLIQTNFDIYKGDSGGPLFDRKGRFLGMMTAKQLSKGHSSFAIPSNRIMEYLKEYLQSQSGETQ